MRAMIVRADKSGLGYQTRALAYMLRPEKIMLIDSSSFNQSKQHPEWYDGFSGIVVKGFPSIREKLAFLQGVTSILTCEIPYGYDLFALAEQRGIKTYLQYNYEFFDYLLHPQWPRPTMFLSSSYWHFEEVKEQFPNTIYLPTPIYHEEFSSARDINLARSGRRRFLHIVGKQAVHDRNGTLSLLEALKCSTADFELVIKSQKPLDLTCDDRRVTFDCHDLDDQAELYSGFDALIMPRRYGGQCLPMCEALMSCLPVLMTDVSPNNRVLPSEWLVPVVRTGEFMTRTMIDIFSAEPGRLGARLDEWAQMDDSKLNAAKADAFELAYDNYSISVLRPKYEALLAGEALAA